jgi:hypothetical protein
MVEAVLNGDTLEVDVLRDTILKDLEAGEGK